MKPISKPTAWHKTMNLKESIFLLLNFSAFWKYFVSHFSCTLSSDIHTEFIIAQCVDSERKKWKDFFCFRENSLCFHSKWFIQIVRGSLHLSVLPCSFFFLICSVSYVQRFIARSFMSWSVQQCCKCCSSVMDVMLISALHHTKPIPFFCFRPRPSDVSVLVSVCDGKHQQTPTHISQHTSLAK